MAGGDRKVQPQKMKPLSCLKKTSKVIPRKGGRLHGFRVFPIHGFRDGYMAEIIRFPEENGNYTPMQ